MKKKCVKIMYLLLLCLSALVGGIVWWWDRHGDVSLYAAHRGKLHFTLYKSMKYLINTMVVQYGTFVIQAAL